MRLAGFLLVVLVMAVPPSVSAATARVGQATHASASKPCTAFGKTWAHNYNAAGGPIKIVSVCCGLRSVKTHLSACKVMVTGRQGMMGQNTFGCSIATVAANGNMLANKPQDCVRIFGFSSLPA